MIRLATLLLLASVAAAPARAQDSARAGAPAAGAGAITNRVAREEVQGGEPGSSAPRNEIKADLITPHITDAHAIEYPCFRAGWACEAELPRWTPLHLGPLTVDLSPTKHVVMLLIAALLCCLVLIGSARAAGRQTRETGHARGFAGGIEAMVLYLRDEVALPNLGHHGEAYVPLILGFFFFILFANLLGLIPFGSTATGNVAVTMSLALVTLVVTEIAGIRAQGIGYLNTIFYWNKDLGLPIRILMFLIMTPVEIIGKLTKPFALTIRLFANMTAGHIVVLAFIGLIFTFHNYALAAAPVLMAVGVMLLEIFVAFLQAYIFALLSAVFIGLIREGAH